MEFIYFFFVEFHSGYGACASHERERPGERVHESVPPAPANRLVARLYNCLKCGCVVQRTSVESPRAPERESCWMPDCHAGLRVCSLCETISRAYYFSETILHLASTVAKVSSHSETNVNKKNKFTENLHIVNVKTYLNEQLVHYLGSIYQQGC